MKTLIAIMILLLTACGNTQSDRLTRCYAKANEFIVLDPPCPLNYSLIADKCYQLEIYCPSDETLP